MNLDALLDGGFEQLADKPEFKPYPAGVHAANIFFKDKQFGEKGKDGAGFEVKFKYLENVELVNSEDAVPKADDEMTMNLNLTAQKDGTRENAQGNLKLILAAAKIKFPEANSVRELIAAAQGQAAAITTSIRKNRQKPEEPGFFQLDKIEFI